MGGCYGPLGICAGHIGGCVGHLVDCGGHIGGCAGNMVGCAGHLGGCGGHLGGCCGLLVGSEDHTPHQLDQQAAPPEVTSCHSAHTWGGQRSRPRCWEGSNRAAAAAALWALLGGQQGQQPFIVTALCRDN